MFLAWAEAAELGTLGGMPPTDYRSTGVQAIPSQEDSVMSVEPLSREIARLDWWVDFWNAVRLWAMVVTAIIAGVAFIAQYAQLVMSKRVSEKKAERDAIRDGQLRAELKDKDLKIAEAGERAEKARLEGIRLRNIVRPRSLPLHVEINGDKYEAEYDRVKAFAGTRAVILAVPDWEARRLANDVQNVLNAAGWRAEFREPQRNVLDGVNVYAGHVVGDQVRQDKERMAGLSLAELIRTIFAALNTPADITAVNDPPLDMTAGAAYDARNEGAVVVTVGVRPIGANLMVMETERAMAAQKAVVAPGMAQKH